MTDYGTADWGTSDDIDEFKRSIAKFLTRMSELSAANEPPGANAANGHFRDAVLSDQELASVIPPRGKADDPEAAQIFQILATFEQGIRGAFSPENHQSSWTQSGALALDALDKLKGELTAVYTAIAAASTITVAALAGVVKSIEELIDKIHSSGIKFEGAHANGWIAKGVKGAAQSASASLDPFTKASKDPYVKPFATAVKGVADQLVAMKDFKNDPWLYGEWQVSFQAIMQAGGVAIAALRPPAAPAPPVAGAQPGAGAPAGQGAI